MRTSLKLTVVMGALAVLCVAGQVSFGQSSPGWSVHPGPMYGLPTNVAPYMVATRPAQCATTARQDPGFRITVVQDSDADKKEATFASAIGPAQSCDKDFAQKGCSQKSCDVKACGCVGNCCCDSFCIRVYGEYLSLRARDAEVVYAVETNSNEYGILGPEYPIQVSPTGVLDQDYSAGFRVGAGIGLDACSEVALTYTWFDTATTDTLSRDPDSFITSVVPMTQHPATQDAISSTVAARGRHDIDFELVDLDYRRFLVKDCMSDVNLVLGLRWGQMQQATLMDYTDDLYQPISDSSVMTDIDFSGVGIRLGLEAERRVCLLHIPALFYVKGMTSLMAGEFDATYEQTGQNNAYSIVDTGWKAGRIVPTFDLELGGGLTTPGGRIRGTLGYVFSSWGNMVKTEDWIRAVQKNNFKDMGDTMTFDGVVARIEARF